MDSPGASTDLPKRLPLVMEMENRDETTSKDARIVNAYIEKRHNDYHVYKRPGLLTNVTKSGNGYGTFNWRGSVYAAFGTTLYKDGTSVGTIDATGFLYKFSSLLGLVPKLFLMNGAKAYTYDTVNGLVAVPVATPFTTTGDTTNASKAITNIASTAGYAVNSAISGTGIPSGAYITEITNGTTIQISADATATAAAVTLTITPLGIAPTGLVRGCAYLDGGMYIVDSSAKLYGSEINDAQTWEPLNTLIAQIEPDSAITVIRQLVYIVILKQWTSEVFYDAAGSVGSPLAAVQGARLNYGCASVDSVQLIDDTAIWMASNRSASFQVVMVEKLKATVISTKAIERLLSKADTSVGNVFSWSFRRDGHTFYILTLKTQNITLAYDLEEKMWYQWTDSNGNYMPIVSATYNGTSYYLQHETNGHLYDIDAANVTDDSSMITVDLYTPIFDANTKRRKYLSMLEFVGDQVQGSILQVRKSDDDYQSWSNFRQVDLSKKKPFLPSCGTFIRRAYHFRHACNTTMRLRAVEMQMELGSL